MPAPFGPSEFCALTPTPSTDPCEAMKRIFFEQPQLLCELLTYMFNEDGTVKEQFIKDVTPVPVGTVLNHAGTAIPSGYLPCDGREVSRTTYADLFAVIGTIYGAGDGATTFNVPDITGKSVFGTKSTDPDFTIGVSGGDKEHTLTESEMPAHTHTLTTAVGVSGGGNPTVVGNGADTFQVFNTGSTGGGGAHNNMPPYVSLQMIIKY